MKNIFYGWYILCASCLMLVFFGGLCVYGFSTFFDPISNEFGWTKTQMSLAFSLRSVESGILAPLISILIDKIGGRLIAITGVVWLASTFLFMSQINSLESLYLTFLLLAIGQAATVGNPQYVIIAHWFSRKRDLVIGILAGSAGLSGIMGPVLVWLISQYTWRGALVAAGISTLIIGLPLTLILRDRPEPYGYFPDGDTKSPSNEAHVTNSKVTEGHNLRQALHTSTFWLLFSVMFVSGFGQSAVTVHVVSFLSSVDIGRELAGFTILGITSFSIIGRLGFPFLCSFINKKYLLLVAALLQFIGILIFSQITNPWMILPFLITYGSGFGGIVVMQLLIQSEYFGIKAYATIRAFLLIGLSISGIFGPVLAGWIFDTLHEYRTAFIFLGFISAIAVPLSLYINLKKTGIKV